MPTLLIKDINLERDSLTFDQTDNQNQMLILQIDAEDFKDEFSFLNTRGIRTYNLPASSAQELFRAIVAILEKEKETESVNLNLPAEKPASSTLKSLTPREEDVLRLVVEGLTNRQIADKLFISPKTVDCHRTNLMKKVGVHNVVDLVHWALNYY